MVSPKLIGLRVNTSEPAEARENVFYQITICLSSTCDWLRGWHEFLDQSLS